MLITFVKALKAASERGVDVKIVVDWKVKKDGSFKKVKDSLDHVEESDNAIKNTDVWICFNECFVVDFFSLTNND